MKVNDKVRLVIYWATLIVSALSAILAGLAAMLGIVEPDAVKAGAEVAIIVLGVITPILALFHFTPTNEG
jgi:hypothetical protein